MRWVMKFFYDVGDTARTLLVVDLNREGRGNQTGHLLQALGFLPTSHWTK